MPRPFRTSPEEGSSGIKGTGLIVDETQNMSDLYEAVVERLTKAEEVLMAVMGNENFVTMSKESLSAALWAAHGCVEEAHAIQRSLWDKVAV
jgi:hypothetical protein